jgi:hypothetical protein
LDVACFDVLKVFCNDASETYVWRNPWKGLKYLKFGGIFAEAWNRATTVGSAVSGLESCGIYIINRNELLEHTFSSGTVHVRNKVT